MAKAKGKEGQQTKGNNKTQGLSPTSSNKDKKNQGAKFLEEPSNTKSTERGGGDSSTGKHMNKPKQKGKTLNDNQPRRITCGCVGYFLMAVMVASAASYAAYIYMDESNEQLLARLDDMQKQIKEQAFELFQKLRSYIDAEGISKEKAEQEKDELERLEKVSKENAVRENIAKEQAAKEQAAKEQASVEQAAYEQAAKEQAAREQAVREQAAREQAARDIKVDIHDQEIQEP